ncbi:MAG: hypothetical protein K9M98_03810 [Cephaloticoccus sp.]|nr:hypothetical protein [Cephaloticoccus sp.]MCF7759608.1 hypothetical protein [Cephaloticoccus sp.]
MLRFLDGHATLYWPLAVGASLLFLTSAIWPRTLGPARGASSNPWLFPLLILLVLVCWRWPFLSYGNELNTDESQFIAGALTLRHDPLFWRSVDGMTAGPLVYYALVPWTLVGIPLDYFTARFTALLLIWLALGLCYLTLRKYYGERSARLGLVPGVIYIASIASDDLNHYSSELISLPLTAAGVALLCTTNDEDAPRYRKWLLLGLVAGLHPWAKLQTGPIGAILALFALVILLRAHNTDRGTRTRQCAALIGGVLMPAVTVIVATTSGGVWRDFYQSYILQNLIYAGASLSESWLPPDLSLLHPAFLSFCLVLGLSLVLVLLTASTRRTFSRPFVLGGCLFGVALFCVLFPGRPYLHYVQLLLVPVVLWSGAAVGEYGIAPKPGFTGLAVRIAVLLGATGLLITRLLSPMPSVLGQLLTHRMKSLTEVDSVISHLTDPGDRLAIWGWDAQSYVTCSLIQGTREAYSVNCIIPSPLQEYHRQTYLADFRSHLPEVFLDSVGPNDIFYQDRASTAHENFPALADLIARNYALVIDLDHSRVYARRDVLSQRKISPFQMQKELASSRLPNWIDQHLPAENLREQHGQFDRINGRDVLMLLPPGRAEWTLQGNERELLLETGYVPRAINQTDGDGTGFVVEVSAPDGTRRIIQSFLVNPRDHADDRIPQSRRIPLPPYATGSKLTVTTNPGPGQNNAWDWAYITHVRFLRSPNYTWRQFPGFNRPPNAAFSPLSTLIEESGVNLLMLHAPSSISFRLTGSEKQLSFAFGFIAGAYRGEQGTNGATFRVSAQLPDGTISPLASRQLQPLTAVADQGRQLLKLNLPVLPPNSLLKIEIDPDGSNAFDWTYLTDVWLD